MRLLQTNGNNSIELIDTHFITSEKELYSDELHLNMTETKVVQIIKCTCTVFIDNFRNISINSSIQVSVRRESYDGYVKHKRNDPMCVPWDCEGNEKMQFLFLLLLP